MLFGVLAGEFDGLSCGQLSKYFHSFKGQIYPPGRILIGGTHHQLEMAMEGTCMFPEQEGVMKQDGIHH